MRRYQIDTAGQPNENKVSLYEAIIERGTQDESYNQMEVSLVNSRYLMVVWPNHDSRWLTRFVTMRKFPITLVDPDYHRDPLTSSLEALSHMGYNYQTRRLALKSQDGQEFWLFLPPLGKSPVLVDKQTFNVHQLEGLPRGWHIDPERYLK